MRLIYEVRAVGLYLNTSVFEHSFMHAGATYPIFTKPLQLFFSVDVCLLVKVHRIAVVKCVL